MIKAVLYDIGGVLYVTRRDGEKRAAFHALLHARLAECGIFIPDSPSDFGEKLMVRAEEYKTYTEGSRLELPQFRIWKEFYLADYAVPDGPLMVSAAMLSDLYDGHEHIPHIQRPHVLETVQRLHAMGMRQGIISNIISKGFAPALLAEYRIAPYMECVTLSSEAGYRKPDARIFEVTFARMGLEPVEVAFVGDTISRDVIGARNAKLACMIQIRNESIKKRDANYLALGYAPDYFIEDLEEIPDIIARCNA